VKLIRFGAIGEEKPGLLLEDETRIDATDFGMVLHRNLFFARRRPAET